MWEAMTGRATHEQGGRPLRRTGCRGLAATLACTLGLVGAPATAASAADLSPYVTDGPVNAITAANGNTYIGGDFSHVARRGGPGLSLSTSSSAAPAALPEIAGGQVYAAAADGAGGWFVGGDFTSVGDQPRAGLAHITSNGSVDATFAPQFTGGAVYALAVGPTGAADAGDLYVGGGFSSVTVAGIQQSQPNLVALYGPSGTTCTTADETGGTPCSGGVIANWTPAPDLPVRALAVMPVTVDYSTDNNTTAINVHHNQTSAVFAGGDFTKIGSQSPSPSAAGHVAAIWGEGAKASCAPSSTTPQTCVTGSQGTPVDVSGQAIGTSSKNSPNGSTWTPTGPSGQSVESLVVGQPIVKNSTGGHLCPPPVGASSDTCTVYAPVYFGGTAGVSAAKFALETSASVGSGNVTGLGTASGAGSYFSWNVPTGLSNTGTADIRALALYPAPNYATLPSAAPSTPPALYVGGAFATTLTNGSATANVHNLAGIQGVTDPSGGGQAPSAYTGWNPSPDDAVNALAIDVGGPTVYVGGAFGAIAGGSRSGAAALAGVTDPSGAGNTASLQAWDPRLGGGATNVLALAPGAPPPAIFAGGAFTGYGAEARSDLAAFDPSGNLVESWQPGVSSICSPTPCTPLPTAVQALAANGSTVYVGGQFNQLSPNVGAGGAPQSLRNLAAVDATTGAPVAGFTPNPDGAVLALQADNLSLFAGGAFSNIGGRAAGLAALDPATGSVQWGIPVDDNTVGDGVYALNASCSTLYVGGGFWDHGDQTAKTIGGQHRNFIAAVDPTNGQVLTWNPGIPAGAAEDVLTIQRYGTVVYAGGQFSVIGGQPRSNIAALDATTAKATSWNPVADYTVESLAADGATVYAGGLFDNVGSADRQGLAALDATSSQATPFNPSPYKLGVDVPSVQALLIPGANLLVGGDFAGLGTRAQEDFGAFPAATALTQAAPCVGAPVVSPPPPPRPPAAPRSIVSKPVVLPFTIGSFGAFPSRFHIAARVAASHTRASHPRAAHRAAKARPRPKTVIRGGTQFRYTISQPASASIVIYQQVTSHRCSATRPHRRSTARHARALPRCLSLRVVGTLTGPGLAGADSLSFSGRMGRHALAPGSYVATLHAHNAAGVTLARSTSFRVLG